MIRCMACLVVFSEPDDYLGHRGCCHASRRAQQPRQVALPPADWSMVLAVLDGADFAPLAELASRVRVQLGS